MVSYYYLVCADPVILVNYRLRKFYRLESRDEGVHRIPQVGVRPKAKYSSLFVPGSSRIISPGIETSGIAPLELKVDKVYVRSNGLFNAIFLNQELREKVVFIYGKTIGKLVTKISDAVFDKSLPSLSSSLADDIFGAQIERNDLLEGCGDHLIM